MTDAPPPTLTHEEACVYLLDIYLRKYREAPDAQENTARLILHTAAQLACAHGGERNAQHTAQRSIDEFKIERRKARLR